MSIIKTSGIRNLKGFTICMALSLALAIFTPQQASAQDTVISFACSQANTIRSYNGEDKLRLRTSDSCNKLTLLDDIDYRSTPSDSLWENATWYSSDGTRRDATLQGISYTGENPSWSITVRTLAFENIDMDPQGQQFAFVGNPIGLTLDDGSVDFSIRPVWPSSSSLTIAAPSGTNIISQLRGNQGPPTIIDVSAGSNLRFADSGCTGPTSVCPYNSRLRFIASENTAVIEGTLDIHRSHVIFPNDSGEMQVRSGGELLISGSNETFLETGNISVDGGKLTLATGENALKANTLEFNNSMVTLTDSGTVEAVISRFTGANTVFLGPVGGFRTTFESTQAVFLSGPGPTLTLTGAQEFKTPQLILTTGAAVEVTETSDLILTPTNSASAWTQGRIDIDVNAVLKIERGGAAFSEIPIDNDGKINIEGVFLPEGAMTGNGDIDVRSGGRLGSLGGDANDTFTTSPRVTLGDNSKFQVFLNATQSAAQQLIANGGFSIVPTVGAFLEVDVFDDVILPEGTKFPIVDYPDGNAIGGRFLRPDSRR